MPLTIEEKRKILSEMPEDIIKKALSNVIEKHKGLNTSSDIITNLNQLVNIEMIVITGIANRDNIPIERIMYDLNNSYYKKLNNKDVPVSTFQYPSDFAIDSKVEPKEPEINVLTIDDNEEKNENISFKQRILNKLRDDKVISKSKDSLELINKLKALKINKKYNNNEVPIIKKQRGRPPKKK